MMKAACDATYEKKIETSVLFCLIFNKKRKKMPRNFVFSFFFVSLPYKTSNSHNLWEKVKKVAKE